MAMQPAQLAKTVAIAGVRSCTFHRRAVELARQAAAQGRIENVQDSLTFDNFDDYRSWLSEHRERFAGQPQAVAHASSPFVFADGATYLGGCQDFVQWLATGRPGAASDPLPEPASYSGCHGLADKFSGARDRGDAAFQHDLSPTAFKVLRCGATEEKGVGAAKGGFDDVYREGVYECAGCGAPVYTSAMKFDCGCGWPGFFRCIDGAVFAKPDKDSVRTEIVCNGCGGHFGHIYAGEGFTGMHCERSGNTVDTDHRHCVNSAAVQLRLSNDEVVTCSFRGRLFLSSFRTPAAPRGLTTLEKPWSEVDGPLPA